jgi:hypothetical protein
LIGNLRTLEDDYDIDLYSLDSPRRPDVVSTPYSANTAIPVENTLYRCVLGVCVCVCYKVVSTPYSANTAIPVENTF